MAFDEVYEKFGGDASLVGETAYWSVLVRPKQVTIGSLVLLAKESVLQLHELSNDALADLGEVTRRLEGALAAVVAHDKINYLLLMMKDPQLHFHVLPRRESSIELFGAQWTDSNWPKPPVMSEVVTDDEEVVARLRTRLAENF